MQFSYHEQSWALDTYRGDNSVAGTVPQFIVAVNAAFYKQLRK
jgi:hypothetical protein